LVRQVLAWLIRGLISLVRRVMWVFRVPVRERLGLASCQGLVRVRQGQELRLEIVAARLIGQGGADR
jgi:hypothetical protein